MVNLSCKYLNGRYGKLGLRFKGGITSITDETFNTLSKKEDFRGLLRKREFSIIGEATPRANPSVPVVRRISSTGSDEQSEQPTVHAQAEIKPKTTTNTKPKAIRRITSKEQSRLDKKAAPVKVQPKAAASAPAPSILTDGEPLALVTTAQKQEELAGAEL